MSDPADLQPVLAFLKDLQKNNNKAWFDKNRPAYEKARDHFEAFIDELIVGLGALEDLGGVTAKGSVMRIYRDIRFSPDKTPYKTHMAASIGPGGRKAPGQKYYLHIEPHDASILAGGLHDPDSAQINMFRAAMGRDARRFKSVLSHADFKRFFGAVEGEKLKTSPQGFDRNHPEIELLRLKSVVAVHHLPDKEVLSPKFGEHAIRVFTTMKPFLDYLNSVVQ